MKTVTGSLPVGLEYNGQLHKEFELRPALVRDTVEVMEESPRAATNRHYAGLCVYAKRLLKLGDIPKEKVTGDLLMEMTEEDFSALSAAGNFRQSAEQQSQAKGGVADNQAAL